MVLEAFFQSFQYFADWQFLLSMMAGVVVGLVFGIIPGIGGLVAVALILPFVFLMTPEQALPLIVAIGTVGFTGGSITAILLNIPGMEPNAATLIDGFPMTQKGQAGRALGAALGSSGAGGIVSVFFALAMVPLVLPIVFAIRSADMVFMILMGISFIAVLSRGSPLKGLISGALGLLISFVGFQIVTGLSRFTFGSAYLYDGFALVPVCLGLFALPEMIALAMRGGTIAQAGVEIKGMQEVLEGVKDVFRHWGLWLRSSIIGYIVGVIPGIGSAVATFVAYGQAKQTSKHPERFGTGIVEGVIAPESANNAKEAGSILTTLALGIPGSSAMVLLLGALLMLGITPGPAMMKEHLDLSFSLLLLIIVANLIGSGICLLAAPRLAKIAIIPGNVLAPLVLVITFVGAFAYRGYFNDVIVTLIFGVVGLAMRKFGYNRPALFLGYILGLLFERYFFIALGVGGPLFFMRPISLILIVITIALLSFSPVRSMFNRWLKRGVRRA